MKDLKAMMVVEYRKVVLMTGLGRPSKPVISSAGGGMNSWIVGGLTGSWKCFCLDYGIFITWKRKGI